jgi:hypothetical protein
MKGDTINITVVNNSIMENAAIHLGMESGRQLKSQEKKNQFMMIIFIVVFYFL